MKHVLCPVDGSAPSLRAAGIASELARALDARLTVLAVQQFVVGRTSVCETWTREEVADILAKASEIAAAKFPHPDSVTVRATDVAQAIIKYASKNGVDLIVMGSTGHGKLRTFFLGSVSTEVLKNSKCPVIINH